VREPVIRLMLARSIIPAIGIANCFLPGAQKQIVGQITTFIHGYIMIPYLRGVWNALLESEDRILFYSMSLLQLILLSFNIYLISMPWRFNVYIGVSGIFGVIAFACSFYFVNTLGFISIETIQSLVRDYRGRNWSILKHVIFRHFMILVGITNCFLPGAQSEFVGDITTFVHGFIMIPYLRGLWNIRLEPKKGRLFYTMSLLQLVLLSVNIYFVSIPWQASASHLKWGVLGMCSFIISLTIVAIIYAQLSN